MTKPIIVIKPKVPAFLTIRTDLLKREWARAKTGLALKDKEDYNKAIIHLIEDVLGLKF